MRLFYYVHTGHRVGLDRLRRSAPVINALEAMGMEVTLLTNDFRAGEYAKEHFGVRRYVSVDVVRNIANVTTPADALVFDSAEEGRGMWEAMASHFRAFIRFSDTPGDRPEEGGALISSVDSAENIFKTAVVDPRYFRRFEHGDEVCCFYGDADYEKRFLALSRQCGDGMTLLEGYYFFPGYLDELSFAFAKTLESEAYDEALTRAGRFLTFSPQSALEALAAGSNPLFLYETKDEATAKRLSAWGVPTASVHEKREILTTDHTNHLLRIDAVEATARYIKDKIG